MEKERFFSDPSSFLHTSTYPERNAEREDNDLIVIFVMEGVVSTISSSS